MMAKLFVTKRTQEEHPIKDIHPVLPGTNQSEKSDEVANGLDKNRREELGEK